jgi:hypothetical protein
MRDRGVPGFDPGRKLALGVCGVATLVTLVIGIRNAPAIRAQDVPDWQTEAGGKMAFEVASVKRTKGEAGPPNFPVNVGEAYRPTGGHFRADFPLLVYIQFAYKFLPAATLEREMLGHSPAWIATDSYNIDARAPASNPTKDQMRLMMQALLADRFKLEAHFETKEVPVFALTLVKAGKLGPKLVLHADGPACDSADSASDAYSAFLYGGRAADRYPDLPPVLRFVRIDPEAQRYAYDRLSQCHYGNAGGISFRGCGPGPSSDR